MMNYTIDMIQWMKKTEVPVPVFAVIENRCTGESVIIQEFEDLQSARKMSRRLNLGFGFDGFTPDFMLTAYK